MLLNVFEALHPGHFVFGLWPQKHPLLELVPAAASYILEENKQANKKISLVQI